jgi:iron complex outermembrane receptor protein
VNGITPRAFAAEDVTDYEIGYKGTFLDGRLRTQLGGYYSEYKNYQTSIVDPTTPSISSIFNVPGKTKLYGVELSAQGSFGPLRLDLATSVSNSKLGTFYAIDPRLGTGATLACNPATGPAGARCINLTGNAQSYAPKFTFSGGVQYAIALSEKATLTPRVDYSHIAATFGTLFQNAALGDYLAQRNIINAQLTLASGDWSIAGFSTNLSDQHYVAAINGVRRLAGAPRQYGLRVSRSF